MWHAPGKEISVEPFRPFQPLQVLYEFDGPKTFTFVGQDDELYLAHWCDEDTEAVRYIVVLFSPALTQQLENGTLTLRQALDQPRVWIVDVDHTGTPHTGWNTSLADLPGDVLPKEGTKLLAALEGDRRGK